MDDNSGLYKSYLVEAHCDSGRLSHEDTRTVIREILDRSFPNILHNVYEISDRFFSIEINNDSQMIIDCEKSRIWKIETCIASKKSESILNKIMKKGLFLDNLWLPSSIQLSIPRIMNSQIRGLSTAFGRDKSEETEIDEQDQNLDIESIEKHSIKISSPNAVSIYNKLNEIPEFAKHIAVTRLETRSIERIENEPNAVALSSIWYNGKITSRGTWFDHLDDTISTVSEKYMIGLNNIDSDRITLAKNKFSGDLIPIVIPNTCISFLELKKYISTNINIFKLIVAWTDEINDATYKMDLIDCHTNDTFVMHVNLSENTIVLKIDLDSKACANVVPRLLTNIQQYINATAFCPIFESINREMEV